MNLTQSLTEQSMSLHAPWGLLGSTKEDVKILVSHDFIVGGLSSDFIISMIPNKQHYSFLGFNVQEGIPMWVSYSISNGTNFSDPSALSWRLDVRLRVRDISICDRLSSNKSKPLLLVPLFFSGTVYKRK